jgi:glycosyltransferase involved in cell wall biosynthesis
MIRTSVVIPTRNRPGPLAACLRALAASFPSDAETIVVSDGDSNDLGPVVAPFVEPLRLRLIRTGHRGPAAARNRGLEAAHGKIVAFTDDDCRPLSGWVTALASGVVLSPPRAVGGATYNGLPSNAYADAAQLVLFPLAAHDRKNAGRERMLPSNNFAFPADALINLGGFDERFRTAEDRELCRRWERAGYALGHIAEAVVQHDSPLNLMTFIHKFFAYGRGAAMFHDTARDPSFRDSLSFHFCLPALLVPELRRRPLTRRFAVAVLILLWEIANLFGYTLERTALAFHRNVAPEASTNARVR